MKARSLHRLIHRLRAVAGIALVVALQSQRQVNAEPAMARASPGILQTAETAAETWRFTTQKPAEGWIEASFNDRGWSQGKAGFGISDTPKAIVGTEWKTSDIWLRREFSLPENRPELLALRLHHDEDAEVYLNGKLAVKLAGFTTDYENFPLGPEALTALKPGRNFVAIHCRQTTGGQSIDVGLIEIGK